MMTDWTLKPHEQLARPTGGVALIILDGVGIGPLNEANAWHLAKTPYLDSLMETPVVGQLRAHGRAVGMPSDKDMGNSEVGHNAMGAGRIFDQGAKLVQVAVDKGELTRCETWQWLMEPVKDEDQLDDEWQGSINEITKITRKQTVEQSRDLARRQDRLQVMLNKKLDQNKAEVEQVR